MNNTNVTVASKSGPSKLVRAKFGPGMLLKHEDLNQLNSYTQDLSRILFKSLFGCGVVCGLTVKATPDACGKVMIDVASGVALACSGDPIWLPKDESFQLNEECDQDIGDRLWVILCGTVKCCAPRTSMCASDDDETASECTRERDGYEIKVVRQDDPEKFPCACGYPKEDPAYDAEWNEECKCVNPALKNYTAHYEGICGCSCDECSDCDCKCVLLARLDLEGDTDNWLVNYQYRRFVRPVLMRDPQVENKDESKTFAFNQSQMKKRVADEAGVAIEEMFIQTAKKSAQQTAQKGVEKIAKEMSAKAVEDILGKMKPEGEVKEVVTPKEKEAPPPPPVVAAPPPTEAKETDKKKG